MDTRRDARGSLPVHRIPPLTRLRWHLRARRVRRRRTSIALVAAWSQQHPGTDPVAVLLETDNPSEAQLVLDTIGVAASLLVRRTDPAAHVDDIASNVIDLLSERPDASLCLTGKAQSIATIRKRIKDAEVSPTHTLVKSYWDETEQVSTLRL